MIEIKCPYDLNQFLFGEPKFENTFPEEECEQRKFVGDCYYCFLNAIASRDHKVQRWFKEDVKQNTGHWIEGKWTDDDVRYNDRSFKCSKCGKISHAMYDFCNCGAKMIES